MLQPTQCTQAATLHVQVFVCDAEGRVAEWNPCLATLTGTEADECLGKPLAGRVAEDQADLVRQLFASPAESEAVLRMLCADGSQLSISFALAHFGHDAEADDFAKHSRWVLSFGALACTMRLFAMLSLQQAHNIT